MTKEQQDEEDRRAIISYMNCARRCAGGRLIVDGHVCLHCGAEEPENVCEGMKNA